MRRTCASMASVAAIARRDASTLVSSRRWSKDVRRGSCDTPSPRRLAATACDVPVARGAWLALPRAHAIDAATRAATVEGTSPRTQHTHVSTFTSCKISAAEATSPWRSFSADSMRVSFARSASQYIFPSVTSHRVFSNSSLVASSSFTDVSSSCSRPWATIPVIATLDCDRRLASNCELAMR